MTEHRQQIYRIQAVNSHSSDLFIEIFIFVVPRVKSLQLVRNFSDRFSFGRVSKNIIRPVLRSFFSLVLQLYRMFFFSHYNIVTPPEQPAYPCRSSKRTTIRFVARSTIGVWCWRVEETFSSGEKGVNINTKIRRILN